MQLRSRAELANLFGYGCTRTFTRRLKEYAITVTPRKLICPQTQLAIFAALGVPIHLPEEEKVEVLPLLQQYCQQHQLLLPH